MSFTPLFDALFYGHAQRDRLIKLDLAMMTDKRAAWVERWNRTVAGS